MVSDAVERVLTCATEQVWRSKTSHGGSVDTMDPESGGWNGPEGLRLLRVSGMSVVRNSSLLQKLQGQRCPQGLARFQEQGGQNTAPGQTWLLDKGSFGNGPRTLCRLVCHLLSPHSLWLPLAVATVDPAELRKAFPLIPVEEVCWPLPRSKKVTRAVRTIG